MAFVLETEERTTRDYTPKRYMSIKHLNDVTSGGVADIAGEQGLLDWKNILRKTLDGILDGFDKALQISKFRGMLLRRLLSPV